MLLITIIIAELLALTGWYCDVELHGDDVQTSFVNNHVVFVIIGLPFTYWIIETWV